MSKKFFIILGLVSTIILISLFLTIFAYPKQDCDYLKGIKIIPLRSSLEISIPKNCRITPNTKIVKVVLLDSEGHVIFVKSVNIDVVENRKILIYLSPLIRIPFGQYKVCIFLSNGKKICSKKFITGSLT